MITGEITRFIATGALFGLTAGISPGPLLALVISETVKHNRAAGMKVAIAPLITDLPIIIIAFVVFQKLSQINTLMGIISFAGASFLVYLGYECFKTKGLGIADGNRKNMSLVKGIAANVLNPHPYLFWITVGTPIVIEAYEKKSGAVAAFFISFYIMLTGSKVFIAFLVGRSKAIFSSSVYIWTMRILGLTLLFFAALFLTKGIDFFRN